jgi:hypothetical protein
MCLADSKLKPIFHDPAAGLPPSPGVGGLEYIPPDGPAGEDFYSKELHPRPSRINKFRNFFLNPWLLVASK